MQFHEKRESAQIIEFPLNRRFAERNPNPSEVMDPRVVEALDSAWYHTAAMHDQDGVDRPKH